MEALGEMCRMRFASFTMRNLDLWRGRDLMRSHRRLFAAVALVLPLAACSSTPSLDTLMNPTGWFAEKYSTKIDADVPADLLYDRGLANLQKRDYEAAGKNFSDLDKRYTYSQWQRKALLMATFSQYQDGKYDDAIGSAQRFITLFPNSSDTAYATYLEAMSYYNLIPDVTRDQDRAQKASVLFEEIAQKYPKSEYAEDARYKLQVTRDQLAGKEMEVGRYYLRDRNYTGAINRFRDVLSKYQTTRHSEEALMRLVEAYLALGIVNEAQTAAAVLGHNFPDSQWYKDAYARLKENGVEPHEDQGSWISKAFHKVGLG
jgi:outer membrane protein assembly factor BamD